MATRELRLDSERHASNTNDWVDIAANVTPNLVAGENYQMTCTIPGAIMRVRETYGDSAPDSTESDGTPFVSGIIPFYFSIPETGKIWVRNVGQIDANIVINSTEVDGDGSTL